MNNNPWIENTGTVPDGVGPDTVIEVEYQYGGIFLWGDDGNPKNNSQSLWILEDVNLDIIRWRFV